MATPSPASFRSDCAGFVVGLTGGIGSGKTIISSALQALGAAVVDTDVIAHALTAPHGAAMPAIASQFGAAFVDKHGALDRARMREHVFASPAAKRQLEAILHPMIRAVSDEATARALNAATYVVVVIPLLVEAGDWSQRVDRVLVVDCSTDTQVDRVMRRSGLVEGEVRAIIAQQATRQLRLAAADDVVVNDADPQSLPVRIGRLHHLYSKLSIERRGQSL